jgi:hypothetical protein
MSRKSLNVKCYIIVFLVAHDEFKGIRIFGKKVFDFCGVTNIKDDKK